MVRKNEIVLPSYTRGEEIFNMVSHIVGGGLGVIALILCVMQGALNRDLWSIIGGSIYGLTLICLYTMSSIYHGLKPGRAKKVMRVMDHCTIYYLIAGTYTPVLLSAIRPISPKTAWTIFGIEWGLAIIATVFTSIDLKRFQKLSMACYIGMGWCIILALKKTVEALTFDGFMLLIIGGISYTLGALIYVMGKKYKYFHSIFHVFVVIGSVFQFFSIFLYAL